MMTMEVRWLGFYMEPLRLALLIVVMIPVLVGLSHLAGFEETFEWRDDLLDVLVAYTVGATTAAVLLFLFSVMQVGMGVQEIIGKIPLQAVPGSIGALLAQSLLGGRKARQTAHRRSERYVQSFFLGASARSFSPSTWRRLRRWCSSPIRSTRVLFPLSGPRAGRILPDLHAPLTGVRRSSGYLATFTVENRGDSTA